MVRGCKHAVIPSYTPHDLRHRCVSILFSAGVPLPIVKEVVGHGRASLTLDVYSHVLIDEPAEYVAGVRARVLHGALGGRTEVAV